ncbi:MAG TPA: Ppx/GppA family phosphatase [Clostridia bacterium]|nr:Ppx/GppA family phosphatase [Clostridia bacterium]
MKAAIDIGTNTIRMLIGKVVKGKVEVHAQFIAEPRLGAGITEGKLTYEAMARALKVLKDYKTAAQDYQVQDVFVVATSAVRDAANKKEFIDAVFNNTGWRVEVITGNEEAVLSFIGAISTLPEINGAPVIIDIGGGSTEVIFQRNGRIKGVSVNVGAVRLWEAAWPEEELRIRLLPVLREVSSLKEKILPVAVGGTATTAAAVLYGITNYSREKVQGKPLNLDELIGLKSRLAGMTMEERKNVAGLTPKRADIIVPGLDILICILRELGVTRILVSDAGILDGLLLRKQN